MKNIKFWIARDEGIYDDDGNIKSKGKLHIFYDKPLVLENKDLNIFYFGNSRLICEVPSYMFPEIKEGDCIEITDYRQINSGFKENV